MRRTAPWLPVMALVCALAATAVASRPGQQQAPWPGASWREAGEHFFTPIGIRDFHWEKTPTGHPDTEGGLHLSIVAVVNAWNVFGTPAQNIFPSLIDAIIKEGEA